MDERIKRFIGNHDKILIISGAGVSTESGIPDFRSQEGLFSSKYAGVKPQDMLNIRYFRKHPQKVYRFINDKLSINALPNVSHKFAKELEESGKLVGVMTQNIDGLYQKAGLSEDLLCEVHGNTKMVCSKCGRVQDIENLSKSRSDNYKSSCHPTFITRPNVLFYDEYYSNEVLRRVSRMKKECDGVLVMGTRADIVLIQDILRKVGKDIMVINNEKLNVEDSLEYEHVEGNFDKLLSKDKSPKSVLQDLSDEERDDLDEMFEGVDLMWNIQNKTDILVNVAEKGGMTEKLEAAIELFEWLDKLDNENQKGE